MLEYPYGAISNLESDFPSEMFRPLIMRHATSDECANLPMRGFFRKCCDSNKAAYFGFIKLHRDGGKRDDCERKEYRKLHNAPPPDEMMPSGCLVA